ncbi:MAG: hypothetical protein JKY37_29210 [Nannocystaceae bacterium]|nr:hypothetical protein [Nannocystaceae bacterium]
MRCCTALALLAIAPACFNPQEPVGATESDSETDASSDATLDDATLDDGTSDGATPDDGDPEDDTTDGEDADDDADDDATSGTSNDATCGDGEVQGAEVCDDGVNDGAYGGCLEDCTGQAAYCGDGSLNGPETCDDGTNDGAYGGCNDDCTAAAFCGDGSPNGPESCDDGDANENGSGCNVDCTTSGAMVDELLQVGMQFCDGAFTTPPQFTADGMALVSASGYCNGDSQLLQRLRPDLEIDETFVELLPSTPMRTAAMVGDRWLLNAGSCNYTLDPQGDFAEVCETGRVTGSLRLEGVGDSYLALDFNVVAMYTAPSPLVGDAPVWTQTVPDPGFYTYQWRSMVAGANDSALVGGSRLNTNDNSRVGYLTQFTAAGNVADTNTYTSVESIDGMAASADGSLLLFWDAPFGHPLYPNGRLVKLNAAFGQEWSIDLVDPRDTRIAFDAAGDIIVVHEDGNGNGSFSVRKLRGDDGTERWSTPLPEVDDDPKIGIAEDDYIWVAAAGCGANGGEFWVGRFAP